MVDRESIEPITFKFVYDSPHPSNQFLIKLFRILSVSYDLQRTRLFDEFHIYDVSEDTLTNLPSVDLVVVARPRLVVTA